MNTFKRMSCFLVIVGMLSFGFCAMRAQQPQQPPAPKSSSSSTSLSNAAQAEALYQQAVAAEVRGSNDDAWKLYLRAAQKDSKAACAKVGHYYLYGNASMCNQNLDLANNYLQIAAALGDDGAAVDLVALQEMRAQKEAADKKAAEAEQASMGWGDESGQEDDDKKDAEERSQAQQLEHKHARSDDEEKEDEAEQQARVKRIKPETDRTVTDDTKKTEQPVQKDAGGTGALAETDQDKAAKERDRAAINASKIEEPAPRNTAKAKKIAKDDSDSEDDIPLGQLIAKPTKAPDLSKEKMQDEDSANTTASVSSRGRGGRSTSGRGVGRGRGRARAVRGRAVIAVAPATGVRTEVSVQRQSEALNKRFIGIINKFLVIEKTVVSQDVKLASVSVALQKATTVLDEKTGQQVIIPSVMGIVASYSGMDDTQLANAKIIAEYLVSTGKFRFNQGLLEPAGTYDLGGGKTIFHLCGLCVENSDYYMDRAEEHPRQVVHSALEALLTAECIAFNKELNDAIEHDDSRAFDQALRTDDNYIYGIVDTAELHSCFGATPFELILTRITAALQKIKSLDSEIRALQKQAAATNKRTKTVSSDQKIASVDTLPQALAKRVTLERMLAGQRVILRTIIRHYDADALNELMLVRLRGAISYCHDQCSRQSLAEFAAIFPILVDAGFMVTDLADTKAAKNTPAAKKTVLHYLFAALAESELRGDTSFLESLQAYLEDHVGELDLNIGDHSKNTPLRMLIKGLFASVRGARRSEMLPARLLTPILEMIAHGACQVRSGEEGGVLVFLIDEKAYRCRLDMIALIDELMALSIDINAKRRLLSETALHRAAMSEITSTSVTSVAQREQLDVIKKLVACGADLTIENKHGKTPMQLHSSGRRGLTMLHRAAAFGDDAFVELLLKAGANPKSTDLTQDGQTPAAVARENGYEKLAKRLEAAEKQWTGPVSDDESEDDDDDNKKEKKDSMESDNDEDDGKDAKKASQKSAPSSSSLNSSAPARSTDSKRKASGEASVATHASTLSLGGGQPVPAIPPVVPMPMAQQQPMVQMPQQTTMLSATQLAAIQRSLANVVQSSAQQQQALIPVEQQEQKQATGVFSVHVDSEGIHYLRDGQPVNESDLTTGERLQLDGVLCGHDVEMPQQTDRDFVPSWEETLLQQQQDAAMAQAQQQDQQQPAALAEDQEDDADDQLQTDEQAQQPPVDNNMDTHEKS